MVKQRKELLLLGMVIFLSIAILLLQDLNTLWIKIQGSHGYIVREGTESFSVDELDVCLTRKSRGLLTGCYDSYGEHKYKRIIDTLWTKTYGGANKDWGWTAYQTSDGGYIIIGDTYSFGAGKYDIYLIKTDANGDTLWTKTYGGRDNDAVGYGGSAVQQTSDGGYIIAGYTYSFGTGKSDVYLIKTDAYGNVVWAKTYGGADIEGGRSVQQTSDGGYIVAGYTASFGAGVVDVYLIKTDANGDTLWTKTYGGAYEDWGQSVQQTSDGGYIITGGTQSGSGEFDVYLIKTHESGKALWIKTYGAPGNDWGWWVQQTSDGGYIIVGETKLGESNWDVYLIKTDARGDTLWTRTYGGADRDAGFSVEQTSDGGYIIAGYTASFGAGGDVYLIKTDANGDTLWTKTYGGPNSDVGKSVEQTTDGGYIIAGYTTSFGAGESDIYLIKTEPEIGIEEKKSSREVLFVSQNEPNPFKDRTLIKYRLPKSSNVHIVICNLLGQEVRTLVNQKQHSGTHTIIWDGRDRFGSEVRSGVYFYKIQAPDYTEIRKMILLR